MTNNLFFLSLLVWAGGMPAAHALQTVDLAGHGRVRAELPLHGGLEPAYGIASTPWLSLHARVATSTDGSAFVLVKAGDRSDRNLPVSPAIRDGEGDPARLLDEVRLRENPDTGLRGSRIAQLFAGLAAVGLVVRRRLAVR